MPRPCPSRSTSLRVISASVPTPPSLTHLCPRTIRNATRTHLSPKSLGSVRVRVKTWGDWVRSLPTLYLMCSPRRNKALRRALITALGDDRARAFGVLSSEMRAGKMSAAQFVNETAAKFGSALSLFKELVALLPDEPRRRALLEAYSAKLLATRGQAQEFPTLNAPSSSGTVSSQPLPLASAVPSAFVPNASVGPSYRSIARGAPSSTTWSAGAPSLSSPTAFPELPTAPSSRGGRGNAASSAWQGDHGNNNNNSSGQGRGKRGKKVLSAW